MAKKKSSATDGARYEFDDPPDSATFVCRHIIVDGAPILEVAHDEGGDWQFLCGGDHSQPPHDEPMVVALGEVVKRDPSVNDVATMNHHSTAIRAGAAKTWTIVDEMEQKIRDAIARVGWFVIGVPDDGPGQPAFAYTIGLDKSYKHPELVMLGLPVETMQQILNDCGARIKKGERFPVETPVTDVLEDLPVLFRKVSGEKIYKEYFGYSRWYYGGDGFTVMQVVWPDAKGRFPGESGVTKASRDRQTLIVA